MDSSTSDSGQQFHLFPNLPPEIQEAIWDSTPSYRLRHAIKAHHTWINSVALSHDGKLVAYGSDSGSGSAEQPDTATGTLWLSDTATGALQHTFVLPTGNLRKIYSIAFSPDGRQIAAGEDRGIVHLWDIERGALQHTFELPTIFAVYSIAFSPDGKAITFGSWDRGEGYVYNTVTCNLRGTLDGNTSWATLIAFSPGGMLVVWRAHYRTVEFWDAKTGTLMVESIKDEEEEESSKGTIISAASAPDGRLAVTRSDYTLSTCLEDAKVTDALKRVLEQVGSSKISAVAVSPDSMLVILGLHDGTVQLWKGTPALPPCESRFL